MGTLRFSDETPIRKNDTTEQSVKVGKNFYPFSGI